MAKLTPHFSVSEFMSKDGAIEIVGPSWTLLVVLESIRAWSKKPIPIRSGYRSPAHNRAVGGASDSRHLHGDAADIPAGIISPADAIALGATGVGVTPDGLWVVHLDTRPLGPHGWPSDQVVRWRYILDTGFPGDEVEC